MRTLTPMRREPKIMQSQIRSKRKPLEIHIEGRMVQLRRGTIIPGLGIGVVGVEIGSLDDACVCKDEINPRVFAEYGLECCCQVLVFAYIGFVDGGGGKLA